MRWNPANLQEWKTGTVWLSNRHGRVPVDIGLFHFLGESRFRTLEQLLAELAGGDDTDPEELEAELRSRVNELVAQGFLQMEWL